MKKSSNRKERLLFGFTILRKKRSRSAASKKKYNAYKETARTTAKEKLAYFNQFYGYTYKKIAIRNQTTRWGSCSTKGNLNFNFRLATLPPELQDYLIVHELCHLKEFNHSVQFWQLVEKQIPDYRRLRTELKKIRF